jgi:protein TonB
MPVERNGTTPLGTTAKVGQRPEGGDILLHALSRGEDRWVRAASLGLVLSAHLALALAALLYTMTPPPLAAPEPHTPLEFRPAVLPPPPAPPPPREIRVPSRIRRGFLPAPSQAPAEPVLDAAHDEIEYPQPGDIPVEPTGEISDPPIAITYDFRAAEPVLIPESKVEPEYPKPARVAGLEARVVLAAVVERDGTVGEIEVISAPRLDSGFSEAAIAAVRQWRYHPARQGGRPVASPVRIEVTFKIDR